MSAVLKPQSAGSLGQNIDYSIDPSGMLTIRIDLSERHGVSSSGKSVIVATTSGNKAIDGSGGVVIGLNAYVKNA